MTSGLVPLAKNQRAPTFVFIKHSKIVIICENSRGPIHVSFRAGDKKGFQL